MSTGWGVRSDSSGNETDLLITLLSADENFFAVSLRGLFTVSLRNDYSLFLSGVIDYAINVEGEVRNDEINSRFSGDGLKFNIIFADIATKYAEDTIEETRQHTGVIMEFVLSTRRIFVPEKGVHLIRECDQKRI